jgi:hypothetical protein
MLHLSGHHRNNTSGDNRPGLRLDKVLIHKIARICKVTCGFGKGSEGSMKIIILTISFLVLLVGVSHSEIYKWIDEKGTVHFTEDPATIPERYRDKAKSKPTEEEMVRPQTGKEAPSIEKVYAFPEKYVGQNLVFLGCKVSQDIEKANSVCKGCYSIGVTSNGGKYVSRVVTRDGITFIALSTLAEQIANDAQGGYEWSYCDISCVVLERGGIHIAVIHRIDVRNMGGKIVKTYKDS